MCMLLSHRLGHWRIARGVLRVDIGSGGDQQVDNISVARQRAYVQRRVAILVFPIHLGPVLQENTCDLPNGGSLRSR